jgi:hypothetical protein
MPVNNVDIPGLGPDQSEQDSRAAQEAGSFYANQAREEQYARQDPDFSRLVNQETSGDVASIMDTIRVAEQWSYQEAIDTYSVRRLLSVALKKARMFSMGHSDLIKQRIVVGKNGQTGDLIGEDGYLKEEAKVRLPGYSIKVDESPSLEKITMPPRRFYDRDPKEEGAQEMDKDKGRWEVQFRRSVEEKVYFGTEKERIALKNANEWLVRNAITSEKLHQQVGAFDNLRAALGEMVKTFYLKQIYSTNEQLTWTFTAPDIEKITAESPENRGLGDRRDKAMRILELVGHCETKEKLEKHLNETFNLEEILDEPTVERTLKIMQSPAGGLKKVEAFTGSEVEIKEAKFKKAVEFLIGKNVTITTDPGTDIKRYTLGEGWITRDLRDPSKTNDPVEKKKRGAGAIKVEKGVRGFLTGFGNPYVKDSRDIMYAINARAALIVGGPDAVGAVRDADRRFWLWGERDRLGLEVYVPDAAIPKGEELVDQMNALTKDQWRNVYAKEKLTYFAINGEPVATDLSKLYHPNFYRLKDHLHLRINGELLTTDKLVHLAESFMSINRVTANLGYGNKREGSEKSTRSVREYWLGFKGDNVLTTVEPAKKLGDIKWENVSVPSEIMEALTGEDFGELDWKDVKLPQALKDAINENTFDSSEFGVKDNAEGFYWLMNYLAGDDNPDKRPWAMFINKVKPDFLMDTDCYTGKIKFERITNGANGAWGDYRSFERWAIENKNAGKDATQTDPDELIERAAFQNVDRTLKAWFAGVRSDPQYPVIAAKDITYLDESNNSKTMSFGSFVDKNAVKYGFLDPGQERPFLKNIRRFKITP